MNRNTYDKMRYQERKANGLCVRFGCLNEPVPGRVLCGYHAEMNDETKRKKKEAGLCECGREPVRGKQHCRICLFRKAQSSGENYGRRKKQGLCCRHGCRNRAELEKVRCKAHEAQERGKSETLVAPTE